jgi:hypothetical protein
MDEQIKKMWYIYIMKYYSAIKKNKIVSSVGKWMEMQIIMLSKISQTQKLRHHVFSPVEFPAPKIQDKVRGGLLGNRKGTSRSGEERQVIREINTNTCRKCHNEATLYN